MPFPSKYQYKIDYMAKHKKVKYKDKVWKQCSPEAKQLAMGLLQKEPEQRLTMQDIVDHPWLADADEEDHPDAKPVILKRHILK